MKLVFDTSALLNIEQQDTIELRTRLRDQGAEVWVPTSVIFELASKARHGLADMIPGSTSPAVPPGMDWIEAGWASDGPGGGRLEFTDAMATRLAGYLHTDLPGREYAKIKLKKAFDDSRDLRNRAISDLWAERAWPPKGAVGVESFKNFLNQKAEAALASDWKKLPKASATIDWLHLGAALYLGARLVSDDTGVEHTHPDVIRSKDLFHELGLTWREG